MSLTERDYLKKYDIKILILSRGRYNTISTHKLLPNYIEVLVPVSEKNLYEEKIDNPILTIPDEVKGLGQVRNWVLDNFKEETIIMIDDDIDRFYCLTGLHAKQIDDPDEFIQILINTAVMAQDMGVHCFGFSQTDIRKYKPYEPFKLCTWVGCIIGVIGRDDKFRDDKFKVDIDFCLKKILRDRIILCNDMYFAIQSRDNNSGGNATYRTEDEYNKSLDSLCEKWGRFLKKGTHKSQVRLKLNVERKQKIDYEQ